MANITADFNACLKQKGVKEVQSKRFQTDRLDHFIQEAYSIHARIVDLTREIRSIRPAYLSTAHSLRRRALGADTSTASQVLTDSDRDAIDAQSKQLLQQLNSAISALKQAEEVRVQTVESVALSKRAKGGLGAIGRWAAGGAITAKSVEEEQEEARRAMLASHRDGVITYLQSRLEEVGRIQSEMMEARLERQIEKSKSVLHKSRTSAAIPYTQDPIMDAALTGRSTSTLHTDEKEADPEQQQAFAEENADMLKHFEDQLDQVRTAERSILEISELHATLHANLAQQNDHIETLIQDSFLTTENVDKGNKELKKASERRSTAQALFYSTAVFCSVLVLWDLVF